MAALTDPITGQALPANAIQRVLFVAPKVHVYRIPPLTSTKGYTAATWTENPEHHIFTARLRVLETGTDDDDEDDGGGGSEQVKVDIVLEDGGSGQLFAAAPYRSADAVEPALDSARFFAVRVQDGQGRRAMLGIGFEERPEAFDFSVALQEARKTAGLDSHADAAASRPGLSAAPSPSPSNDAAAAAAAAKHDYSLKDGETITVNLTSSRFARRSPNSSSEAAAAATPSPSATAALSGFSLPPPPPPPPPLQAPQSSSAAKTSSLSSFSSSPFSLPPPPPPASRRAAARRSIGDPSILGLSAMQQQQLQSTPTQTRTNTKSAAELGFDDGPSGEFA